MIKFFTIDAQDDGVRLDRWFKRHYPNVPHGELQKAMRKGLIRIDNKKAKTSDHVSEGQELSVKFLDLDAFSEKSKQSKNEPKPLSDSVIRETRQWIIEDTNDWVAINKPAGMAVQGGSGVKDHVDVRLDALQFDHAERPKLVHRLDKDTSGVLLLARYANAAAQLANMFATKRAKKTYWALVVGVPEIRTGEIEGSLSKSDGEMQKMMLDEDGKPAITAYRVIEALGQRMAWVELEPITGRTHQLRVHMAQMGNPILGDGKYGGQEAFVDGLDLPKQLHLHAHRLQIDHVFGSGVDVSAPLPPHMRKSFKELGLQV
ncbi:MAG: RluA family pseudouridine synthase [Rickettsiales bacterium]|nr:RluA family pseudouridine synthase [Rickettsiales bacterium]